MRSKRQVETDSSLELLLDTITNAFGGIMFIAILTVLLMQRTSPTRSANLQQITATRLQILESQHALTKSSAELEQLRRSIADQDRTLGRFTSNDSRDEYSQVQVLREQIRQLQARQGDLQRDSQEIRQKEQSIAKRGAQIERELEQSQKRSLELESRLADAMKRQTRDTPVPLTRKSDKSRSIPLVLRHGRLYVVIDYNRMQFNANDFLDIDRENGQTVLHPNPLKGFPVADALALESHLKQKLSTLDLEDHIFDIAVWNDSFAEFQILKKCAINLSIEYRTLVFDKTGKLTFGSSNDKTVQ